MWRGADCWGGRGCSFCWPGMVGWRGLRFERHALVVGGAEGKGRVLMRWMGQFYARTAIQPGMGEIGGWVSAP